MPFLREPLRLGYTLHRLGKVVLYGGIYIFKEKVKSPKFQISVIRCCAEVRRLNYTNTEMQAKA